MIEITDSTGNPLVMRRFELPTERIPLELRPVGSRFFFEWDAIYPDESDSMPDLRARSAELFRIIRAADV